MQLDILQSKGKVIDWLDATYFFTKHGVAYELKVYLGTITEQVREIKLNALQVNAWQEKGREYIKELT